MITATYVALATITYLGIVSWGCCNLSRAEIRANDMIEMLSKFQCCLTVTTTKVKGKVTLSATVL